MTTKIGFIGCGNMAQALIGAFISSKAVKPGHIIASDKQDRADFAKNTGIAIVTNQEVVDKADIIFIAVKPQNIDEIMGEIKGSDKVFVSIAAGVPTSKFKGIRIVRLMPTMACQVNEMVSAVYFPGNITDDEKKEIKKLLDSVGKSFELKEEQFDAFTALVGSGPGFFAYFIDAYAKVAEKYGFDSQVAFELINNTCLGTSKLMKEKSMGADELIKKVMSPGGTTEAGIKVLKESKLKEILEDTIKAAVKRGEELGK